MATPTTPTGIQLCQQGDVELVLGGAAVLIELLDKTDSGVADANLVTAVIAHASSEAMAAVATQYLPSQIVAPYPDVLVFATARLAGYYAWAFGSQSQARTDLAKELRDAAMATFEKISRRQLSLGVAVDPATNQAVSEIDRDPNYDQTTRVSTRGSLW